MLEIRRHMGVMQNFRKNHIFHTHNTPIIHNKIQISNKNTTKWWWCLTI